jgi:8-oxo-dGTP pyrophosphatase MutT (NUDIX family)
MICGVDGKGVAMAVTAAVKKESTASALVYSRFADGWRLCLIMHPRLGMLLPAGGHVESNETTAEAALREVAEETGLQVRLLSPPAVPVPEGTPHIPVPAPWWILEMQVPTDRHEPRPHVHVDFIYVAVADQRASSKAAHETFWLSAAELAEHSGVVEDTRLLANEVFFQIDELVAKQPSGLPGFAPLPVNRDRVAINLPCARL